MSDKTSQDLEAAISARNKPKEDVIDLLDRLRSETANEDLPIRWRSLSQQTRSYLDKHIRFGNDSEDFRKRIRGLRSSAWGLSAGEVYMLFASVSARFLKDLVKCAKIQPDFSLAWSALLAARYSRQAGETAGAGVSRFRDWVPSDVNGLAERGGQSAHAHLLDQTANSLPSPSRSTSVEVDNEGDIIVLAPTLPECGADVVSKSNSLPASRRLKRATSMPLPQALPKKFCKTKVGDAQPQTPSSQISALREGAESLSIGQGSDVSSLDEAKLYNTPISGHANRMSALASLQPKQCVSATAIEMLFRIFTASNGGSSLALDPAFGSMHESRTPVRLHAACEHVLVPVHHPASNWTLGVIAMSTRQVTIYDPLGTTYYADATWRAIASVQLCHAEEGSIISGFTRDNIAPQRAPPWQSTAYDCGIYILLYGVCTLLNRFSCLPGTIDPDVWRFTFALSLAGEGFDSSSLSIMLEDPHRHLATDLSVVNLPSGSIEDVLSHLRRTTRTYIEAYRSTKSMAENCALACDVLEATITRSESLYALELDRMSKDLVYLRNTVALLRQAPDSVNEASEIARRERLIRTRESILEEKQKCCRHHNVALQSACGHVAQARDQLRSRAQDISDFLANISAAAKDLATAATCT
ncbi:hypothetical protein BAUCODRAFT_332219 [Baudoinia panamericana UAMH 10762]|uniref:Ubiquitin-like protease family profile domain-containing protein n=1 Tax=Baudoinia panamericana (strain UAMH 10762) TaxID=717646 RepID=M2MI52_BAUPA|nr:uncharacterized protein BAUCODRAFT_332219 [Baudoinia panamericana UAMH 10762]EMC90943.1 hypothetical protein BAUCODRAFT_332219 [Baudoinia panamericana UAMH 10762]